MKELTIKTQDEFDELPKSFEETTYIYIKSEQMIYINETLGNSHVEVRGNSHVEVRGNSHVEAWGNSHVVAWGNSHVEAWGNSHVVARENSHVVARENSHVVALENSHVVAWENSHVEAWGNSHVVARENSHVEAWGNVTINTNTYNCIVLFSFAVAVASKSFCKYIKKKSKNAYIQVVNDKVDWFENNGINISKRQKNVILFKRVSNDFKTQEETKNETLWKVGTIVNHSNWNPTENECGEGKFHACSKSYFCDEFRSKSDDRYIALKIAIADTAQWEKPTYSHKIAFRKGKVLYECDRYGNKITK